MQRTNDTTWIYRGPEGDVAVISCRDEALARLKDYNTVPYDAKGWEAVCSDHIFDAAIHNKPVVLYAPKGQGPRLLVDGVLLDAKGRGEHIRPEHTPPSFRDLAAAACASLEATPDILRFVKNQCYAGNMAASIGPSTLDALLAEETQPWANSGQWFAIYHDIIANAKGGPDIVTQLGDGKGSVTIHEVDRVPVLADDVRLENLRRIIPEQLRDDPLFMRRAISFDPVALKLAAPSLLDNAAFVDLLVKTVPLSLAHMPSEWLADRDFVLEKLHDTPAALYFAAESLRTDRNFVLQCVAINGMALAAVAELWGNDRDIVTTAVAQSPHALEFASDTLRDDKSIVLPAVTRHGYILRHAGPACRADRDIVRVAALNCAFAMQDAHPDVQKDRALILEIAEQDGNVLKYAAPVFSNDPEVWCAAMRGGANLLRRDIPKALRANLDIALNSLCATYTGLYNINHAMDRSLGKAIKSALCDRATMAAAAAGIPAPQPGALARIFGILSSRIPPAHKIASRALEMGLGLHPQLVAPELLSDPVYVRNAITAAQTTERGKSMISRYLWNVPLLQGRGLAAIATSETALDVLSTGTANPPRHIKKAPA